MVQELIDTLWNVNLEIIYRHQAVIELIDTLWNVNSLKDRTINASWTGINRYIMECKFSSSKIMLTMESRINRYIMECKYQDNTNQF